MTMFGFALRAFQSNNTKNALLSAEKMVSSNFTVSKAEIDTQMVTPITGIRHP